MTPDLAAESFCYLSTRGRVSGRTHTIEIWFATRGDVVYLLSGGGERSDWVRNMRADPAVAVRIGGRTWKGRAQVVSDPSERSGAARLLYEKYAPGYGGDLTRWRDTALVVAVTLLASVPEE